VSNVPVCDCVIAVCFLGYCRPESVPRLFDLVRVKDEMFRPVFYFALRDTLVANDLSQATRIAYGKTRYRVVTLAGQLIEMSGWLNEPW
jgi:structural maintenance of chromosome 4